MMDNQGNAWRWQGRMEYLFDLLFQYRNLLWYDSVDFVNHVTVQINRHMYMFQFDLSLAIAWQGGKIYGAVSTVWHESLKLEYDRIFFRNRPKVKTKTGPFSLSD